MSFQTQRPIRLLYLIPGLGTGGTERLVVDCATRLDPKRFQVSVGALDDGEMRAELEEGDIPVHLLSDCTCQSGRFNRVLARRRLIRALAKNVDIIHTHHLWMLLFGAIARFPRQGWRWVHTEHARPDVEVAYDPWLVSVGRVLMRLPDTLCAISQPVTEYFAQNVLAARSRCHTIFNAVDVDRFSRPYDRGSKRNELNIPAEAWVVGSVGRLRPEKNHALLIRAFAQLLPSVPGAVLVLVGGGELRNSLERLVDELQITDRVRFLGTRLDIPELLAAFDTYCLPSRYEGMPLTVFEAMAAGLPIVATEVQGIRDVVRDGETGLLVPPDDAAALAQAMLRLRKRLDISAHIALQGRQYVERHGRLEMMLDQYASLYESLVGGPPGEPTKAV